MKLVSAISHFALISLISITSANAGSTGTVTYAPFAGENIPTLSGWMLIMLSLLLMLVAFRSTKYKQSGSHKLFITLLGVSLLSLGSGAFQIQNSLVAAPPPELSEAAGGDADVFGNQFNTLANTSGVTQRITGVDVTSIQCDNYVGDGSVAGECVAGLVVGTGASCTVDCTAIPTTGNIVLTKNVTQGNPNEPTQRFSIGATNGDDFTLGTGLLAGGSLPLNDLSPGTYTVNEETIPANWNLDNISCSSTTGDSTFGIFTTGNTSLDVNLVAGDTVTCTFSNSYTAPPLIQFYATKLRDDGIGTVDFDNDEKLAGWEFWLYDNTGKELTNAITGANGQADLGLHPAGTYTWCETNQIGWTNVELSTPSADPANLGRPCYTGTIAQGIPNISRNFWNHQTIQDD